MGSVPKIFLNHFLPQFNVVHLKSEPEKNFETFVQNIGNLYI